MPVTFDFSFLLFDYDDRILCIVLLVINIHTSTPMSGRRNQPAVFVVYGRAVEEIAFFGD